MGYKATRDKCIYDDYIKRGLSIEFLAQREGLSPTRLRQIIRTQAGTNELPPQPAKGTGPLSRIGDEYVRLRLRRR